MDSTNQHDLGAVIPEPFPGAYCRNAEGGYARPPRHTAPAPAVALPPLPAGIRLRSDEGFRR